VTGLARVNAIHAIEPEEQRVPARGDDETRDEPADIEDLAALDALILLDLRAAVRLATRGVDDHAATTALLMADELHRGGVDSLGEQDVVEGDHGMGVELCLLSQ
jgi:hypothetical protein